MRAKKRDKSLRTLVLIIFGLIVISTVFFILLNQYKNLQFEKLTPAQQEDQILNNLAKYLNTSADIRENRYSDWINNGKTFPLIGKSITINTQGKYGAGKYCDVDISHDLAQINKKFIDGFQNKVSEYFDSIGFTKSMENTYSSNNTYRLHVGFYKDNIFCTSTGEVQTEPFGSVSCGIVDKNQLALQKELSTLRAEQEKNYSEFVGSPLLFRVDKIDGNFATGSLSGYGGGYQWIARKVNGDWEAFFKGQEMPDCPEMAKYQVPSSMYPSCYNSSTQQVQKTY